MKNKFIENWEKATNDLAMHFVEMYYGPDYLTDCYWVSGEVGDMLIITEDDFYSLDRMREAIIYNASFDQLRDYEEYELDFYTAKNKTKINFRNYLKLGLPKET